MNGSDDPADKGLSKARTRAEPDDLAASPPSRTDLDQAVAALGSAIAVDDEGQLDLLSGSPDLEPIDALGKAAENSSAERRGRGRPKGSANRRNTAVFEYLEALGHRDPAVTLSLIQSADTVALAKALGANSAKGKLQVLAIQRQAAAELMPYKYAKKPTALEVNKRELHVFLAGSLGGAQTASDGTLFGGGQMQQIQGVSDGTTVRHDEDESHENSK